MKPQSPKRTQPKGVRLPDSKPPVVVIDDLAQLETMCGESIEVQIPFNGKMLKFVGCRLRPMDTREIQLLLERALPPKLEREGEEPRYDMEDPGYRESKEKFRRQARALALWRGFPQFKKLYEAQPEAGRTAPTVEVITEFIEGRRIEDDILDHLFGALTHRLVEAQAYVGFTSGNSSLQS